MDWEGLWVGILVTAGVPTAAYLIGMGASGLKSVLAKAKAEAATANQQLLAVGFEAADRILTAVAKATVGKLESTSAAELREKVKAGESEWEELQALSRTALEEILEQLKPEIRESLLQGVADLEAYITNRIETVLPEEKAAYAKHRALQETADQVRLAEAARQEAAQDAPQAG